MAGQHAYGGSQATVAFSLNGCSAESERYGSRVDLLVSRSLQFVQTLKHETVNRCFSILVTARVRVTGQGRLAAIVLHGFACRMSTSRRKKGRKLIGIDAIC